MNRGPVVVVGAGYAGIAAGRALVAAGIPCVLLDAADGPGGLWRGRVYPGVRLVTSTAVTAYDDLPMEAAGVFPTGPEMLAYLEKAAADLPVRTGARVAHANGHGVSLTNGEHVAARAVVLATGRLVRPVRPALPGAFAGGQLHSADYRTPAQLGPRVLVVGCGNSALDIALEALAAGRQVWLSVRDGAHVLPVAWHGRPLSEQVAPAGLLGIASRAAWRAWAGLRFGGPARLGLPPSHERLLKEAPVLHSAARAALRGGTLPVRDEIASLRPGGVTFASARGGAGTDLDVDTVVWATGWTHDVPVPRVALDGRSHGPLGLVANVASPVTSGLYAIGHAVPLGGNGPLLSSSAALIADLIGAQDRCSAPLAPLLARFSRPDGRAVVPLADVLADQRRLRAALPAVLRLAHAGAPA